MPQATDLIQTLRNAEDGLSLAELLAHHPDVTRRTAQRWLLELTQKGRITARGEGRGRRYFAPAGATKPATKPGSNAPAAATPAEPPWFGAIPLSADSRDIAAYVEQATTQRTPVGWQIDFLQSYQPNKTWYLSAPLRRQLQAMGQTAQAGDAAGTYSRAILGRLLIDLSWASSHLEGNTYSRLDTRELIEHGRAAQGKGAIETQMILNHKAAIELLVENIEQVDFDRFTLLNLHSALSENLLPNPADEGRLRQHAVDIGQSVYRPLAVPAQIESAFDTLLTKARRIKDPFEQSFFTMVHLPYLQPFADMNKRTSRLAANLPLFRANLCPLTFLDVPEQAYSRAMLGVYEMTRVELLRELYVWAYERSTHEYLAIRQDLAQPDPLRLAWRELIRATVREVVTHPKQDAKRIVARAVKSEVPESDRAQVQALITEELRRLHEGVLARYGVGVGEFEVWRTTQERL